jgi:hypothetical protein
MIYVAVMELLSEALEEVGLSYTSIAGLSAWLCMTCAQSWLKLSVES